MGRSTLCAAAIMQAWESAQMTAGLLCATGLVHMTIGHYERLTTTQIVIGSRVPIAATDHVAIVSP